MKGFRNSEKNFSRRTNAPRRMQRIPAVGENNGIVLALGGGFSRGFAHLGVLEVLKQEQISVSAIVGTSVGALLGAAYADGISIRELCELGRRVRVRDFLRFHQKEPGSQVDRKDCIGQFVQDWFRAKDVAELAIPTAIVTTDLGTGAPYVFTRGPLEVALRAGCAFPGLVKPVAYEGLLLADGCIVAPVPTAIAARIHGGCVLGVSVGMSAGSASFAGDTAKGFDPFSRDSRGGSSGPAWSRHADVLLEPQVQHIDWNDFSRVDEAFAAGAEAMRDALPGLREVLDRRAEFATGAGACSLVGRGLAI